MIQLLLDGAYSGTELRHVRMESSRTVDAIGKWQLIKVWRVFTLVARIYYAKLRWRPDALYYPPCGPGLLPVARDIAVLCATRPLFRSTIFHFHASGLTEYGKRLHPFLKTLFDLAYRRPNVAIRLSLSSPSEGRNLDCLREYIVANGVRDAAGGPIVRTQDNGRPIQILFVALLTADKGVLVAIEAVNTLLREGVNVRLTCVGGWESTALKRQAESLIDPANRSHFVFPGVLTGENKWEQYRIADVFCFPSFFHSETFPLVLLEAMSFGLPIISTRWRGIPDVVDEGTNAILTEPKDVASCVRGLATLIDDALLRAQMGHRSRKRFLEHFTIDRYQTAMEGVFLALKEDCGV